MHTATHRIESDDGLGLSLRERSHDDPDAAVVFVHGATYAGRGIFDPAGAPEHSWLRWAANAGQAAFALDVRGYGDSERPPGMDGDGSEPPSRLSEATEDVDAAIAAVRERVSGPIHLVGTSWGTMISGALLARPDAPDVASLTLHAPVFDPDPSLLDWLGSAQLSATRTVTRGDALSRWNEQVPDDPAAAIRGGTAESDPVFEAFWKSLTSSGQGRTDGEEIIAPNGTLADLAAAAEGDHPYDPASIDVPTLVVRGSLDPTATRADALDVYDRLSVPGDEAVYAEIEGGTHFVHLENRREALYETVESFQSGAGAERSA